jgi:hypothetical protein
MSTISPKRAKYRNENNLKSLIKGDVTIFRRGIKRANFRSGNFANAPV